MIPVVSGGTTQTMNLEDWDLHDLSSNPIAGELVVYGINRKTKEEGLLIYTIREIQKGKKLV